QTKWLGFETEDSTWEPLETFIRTPKYLETFLVKQKTEVRSRAIEIYKEFVRNLDSVSSDEFKQARKEQKLPAEILINRLKLEERQLERDTWLGELEFPQRWVEQYIRYLQERGKEPGKVI